MYRKYPLLLMLKLKGNVYLVCRKTAIHNFNDTNQGLEDYFRISVFISYIDYFISQLELRFLAQKRVF